MKSSTILHERETTAETEAWLKANGEKLNNQCIMVLKLLYSVPGKKYTAKMVNDILDIADGGRRLRNLFAFRNDVKREWGEHGKYYWLEIPNRHPTKKI